MHALNLQISCDGVSEARSNTVSLDVYSTRVQHCQVVFPHRIVRPLAKTKIDHHQQLASFIDDILETNAQIQQYIADNLKRATGKACLNHASTFPCEYCYARGVRFVVEDASNATKKNFKNIRENLSQLSDDSNKNMAGLQKEIDEAEKKMKTKQRSHLVWPFSTCNAEPRTHESVTKIMDEIEEKGKLPPEEAKGVVGKSALLKIPNFDIVRDSPTEYLHSVCLGVSKSLIKLTFNVGETWPRNTNRKLCNPHEFTVRMEIVKVFKEFSRRNRALDLSVMKGQEYRNIVIFFSPLLLTALNMMPKKGSFGSCSLS